jgi:hypothetical protein
MLNVNTGELQATPNPTILIEITYTISMTYSKAGCLDSVDSSDYRSIFSNAEFSEVYARNRKAWERLAHL